MRSWWTFGIGAALVAGLWLSVPTGSSLDADLVTYRAVLEHMDAGADYYAAMNAGLTETAGGPVAHVWNYRLPTMFWVWHAVGLSWPLTLAIVLLVGVLVGMVALPGVGLMVVIWMAAVLHPVVAEQWAFVEVWTLPLMVGAVLAIRRDRWALAALLALGAASIREFAVLMLVGGLVAAWLYRKALWPWLAALAAVVAFYAWHYTQAQPYLVAQGAEPPTVGTGSIWAMVTMAGPYTFGVGLVIAAAAVWTQRRTPAWWLAAPVLVAIPLAGLFTSRFHWGLMVLPLAVALLGPALLVPAAEHVGGDVLDGERAPDVQAHSAV